MSKYQKLTSYLASLRSARWTAHFGEIEAVLGFPLPNSARSYPAWWSNQAGDGHSQNAAWQSIGWRTGELDLAGQRVTFLRQGHAHRKPPDANATTREGYRDGLTIAEAKAGLSIHFGVPPESVEIIIKG
jgi:hypothetical protein